MFSSRPTVTGARLACDVPVIATGAQAPAWLDGSGLALDQQGFILTDACRVWRRVQPPHAAQEHA